MSLLTITNQSFLAPQGTWKVGKPLLPSHSRIPLSAVLFWFLFRSFLDDAVVVATSSPQPKGRFLTAHRSLVKQSLDIALFIPCSVLSLSASFARGEVHWSFVYDLAMWHLIINSAILILLYRYRSDAARWTLWAAQVSQLVSRQWVSEQESQWMSEGMSEWMREWVSELNDELLNEWFFSEPKGLRVRRFTTSSLRKKKRKLGRRSISSSLSSRSSISSWLGFELALFFLPLLFTRLGKICMQALQWWWLWWWLIWLISVLVPLDAKAVHGGGGVVIAGGRHHFSAFRERSWRVGRRTL